MSDVIKLLAVTAEVLGTEWSECAAEVVAEELRRYPLATVKTALARCRCELRGRLTLHDILDRLPGGHPGAEEAWGMVAKSLTDEAVTVVRTEEMRQAFAAAWNLKDDPIAARLAFKETYTRCVNESRAHRQPIRWSVSLGTDASGRVPVLSEAVKAGYLTAEKAARYLPPGEASEEMLKLAGSISGLPIG